ncbi:MAG: hypothetical protein R3176_07525 [Woeseiaceae bacterium]|nr:hypothetical protein [Woeseiaceae bacterium]
MQNYADVPELLRKLAPVDPVYCIYPHVYRAAARRFLDGFPGRVLYAVKANNDPTVLRCLLDAGVGHFDCASLPEIEQVRALTPDAACYFMNPVRLPGTAAAAQQRFGVRHFVVDHATGLESLLAEIDPRNAIVFARMAVSHETARVDLSTKFGASPEDTIALLEAIAGSGAEPALAFNVGSVVMSPAAYVHALEAARGVLEALPFPIRLLDIGGGYPKSYPGFEAPPLEAYFDAIRGFRDLPLAANGELLAEPGRALAARGLSAVVRVLLRKDDRLYLNDGMYGSFWELRFKVQTRFAARAYRGDQPLDGERAAFRLYGPTCDSGDMLPGDVELPANIRAGDWIEFGSIGAYSLHGRTDFNGFYSDTIVTIDAADSLPPA